MTKIIKGVLLLTFLIVATTANAQKGEDTMVGRIFVSRGAFSTYTTKDDYGEVLKHVLNDDKTGKPAEVAWASEWKCEKVTRTDYILSDSGVTIKVTKTLPYEGQNKYWIPKSGNVAVLSISGFSDKINMLAAQKRDSLIHIKQAADQVKEDSDLARESRKDYADNIKKYGQKIADNIRNNIVEIGMTKEMCEEAWGDPIIGGKSESIVDGVPYAVWIYERDMNRTIHTILYFKNGLLTDQHVVQMER